MPREKKDYKNLNIKLARPIYETLERFCEENGITKTTATERILDRYVKDYFRTEKEEWKLN